MILLTTGALYVVFQSSIVQNVIITVITKNISKRTNTDVSIKRVDIKLFRKVIIEDVYLSDQQKDTLFYTRRMVANIDSFLFFKHRVHLKSITFDQPNIHISKLDSSAYNFNFLLDLFNSDKLSKPNDWRFFCSGFELNRGRINYTDPSFDDKFADLINVHDLYLILDSLRLSGQGNINFNIDRLKFKSKNGFEFENFSSKIDYADSIFMASGMFGKTRNSQVSIDSIQLDMSRLIKSGNIQDLAINLDLKNLDLGMRDLSYFLGPDYNKTLHAKLSGKVSGDIYNLRGKQFKLSVENFTHLNGDFYINDLSDINSAYIFFDLNESYADLTEIRNLNLPSKIQQVIDSLPNFLNNVGSFSYKGNFTGFLDDFVAYGTVYSNLGVISSDISFKPSKNEILQVNGHLITSNLDVGKIFKNDKLYKLSLSGEINGTVDYSAKYNLTFDGVVDSVDFNHYRYHKINMLGNLQNSKFNGSFSILDPNIKMKYSGTLDLSPELPVFEFVANIDHANLFNLHLIEDKDAQLKLNVDANFVGSNIDNVEGHLSLTNISYKNSIDEFFVKELVLNNTPQGDTSVFTINSDFLDGEISGHYSFTDIRNSVLAFYHRYLPSSLIVDFKPIDETNDFEYAFDVKDIFSITKVFVPDFHIEPNFKLAGVYKPLKDSVYLETFIPLLQYKNKKIENIRIVANADSNRLYARVKLDKTSINKKLNVYNLTLESTGQADRLSLDMFWNNYAENTFSGTIKTLTTFKKNASDYPTILTQIEPSNIYFADSVWTIDETKIRIDSTAIGIDQLNFHHNNQRFLVDGKIANNSFDKVFAKIENVDMALFEPLMGKSYFSGKINGTASLVDAYEKVKLNLDLFVNDFTYADGLLGDFHLSSWWNTKNETLQSEVSLVNNDKTIFKALGTIDPMNTRLDMNLTFDNSPVSILQSILPSTFNNENGLVKGNVRVHGDLSHILHDGVLTPVNQAAIGLSYLNTTYYFSNPVIFSNDSIIFKNIHFTDIRGNTGIFNGSIIHHTFKQMVYNMKAETSNLMVLNTTATDNDYLYGTAYVGGTINITGEGNNILLSGDLKTNKGTTVNIPYDSGENAQQYDFIEFVNNNIVHDEEPEYNVVTSGLDMNFDLDVTPDAKVQIIFNSQVGDVIKGSGSGALQVKVDRNYNISLYGHYVIEEGDYLFTLQNVLNKRFSIDKGSTIEWTGDPYNALINIKAAYKLKSSLYDLFVGSYQDFDLTRRIPVDCIIHLTENLTTPKITFNIDLPTADERIKDAVNQLIVTNEDVNKQIISLMMLGHFYTPEFIAGKPTSPNSGDLVGATASDLLSNQLSNWLSKISDNFDLGIKYRPGNEVSKQQVELALSTQILNDRVTIDGNVANNANPNSTNNGAVVGDFDLNIKLTDNGKLKFKAYNHANDNIIYDTAPYTQGVGFTYFEDFNSLADLKRKWKNFFCRKTKKKGTDDLKNE